MVIFLALTSPTQALEEVPGELNTCAISGGSTVSLPGLIRPKAPSSTGPALSLFLSNGAPLLPPSSSNVIPDPPIMIGSMQLNDRSHSMAIAARAATLATLTLQSDKIIQGTRV